MKILVVDDEKDVQVLFEQRFRKETRSGELAFQFANSGLEALSYLRGQGSVANLVLSDINMPGMNGLELLQQIKKNLQSPPPVIMITAYGDDYNYNQAKHLGADDFLTKPLDFTLLKEKIRNQV